MNPEKLGVKLAQELRWGVDDIGAAIIAALTEANCHELARTFEELLTMPDFDGTQATSIIRRDIKRRARALAKGAA